MSRRGQVFENPVTGERAILITDPLEHPEGVLVAELQYLTSDVIVEPDPEALALLGPDGRLRPDA